MGKTYVYIFDSTAPHVHGDNAITPFSVYNEAMSYAKFMSNNWTTNPAYVIIWNMDGGSGYWRSGAFTSQENTNYPS